MIIALFSVCNALFGGVWLVRDPKRTVATICANILSQRNLAHADSLISPNNMPRIIICSKHSNSRLN